MLLSVPQSLRRPIRLSPYSLATHFGSTDITCLKSTSRGCPLSELEFTALRDLVRRPARKASASEPDIVPVHAGLFDAEANPLLASFVGTLPSMRGALAAIRAFFKDNWQPGDVALTNDMDAGAVNACEIIAAAPIFSGKVL